MKTIEIIPISNLFIGFLPVILVVYFQFRWRAPFKNAIYALCRMLIQLLLIGYFLIFIFGIKGSVGVFLVLTVMILISTWISLNSIREKRTHLFLKALGAIAFGGGLTLFLMVKGVLGLEGWDNPSVIIPLAGMTFANAMNSVSLAAERFFSDIAVTKDYPKSRNTAFKAALIPITNSLFAVGLVSLPGMMTGQILSGVNPLIAARYQIMIMSMLFGAMGMSAAIFLRLLKGWVPD